MKRISILLCLLFSTLIVSETTQGEVYPNKPVTIMQAFGVGGSSDMLIRGVSPYLIKELKTQIVIQNVPGAGGVIGYNKFYKLPPDGYNLLFTNFPTPYTAELNSESDYYRTREFEPISAFAKDYIIVAVHPDTFQNADEFIKAARSRSLRIGVTGVGVTGRGGNLNGYILEKSLGVHFTFVPYPSGGASLTALAGNHIDAVVTPSSSAANLVRAKRIKLLLAYADERRPQYPQVPTLKELGYGPVEVYFLYGAFAPPRIPQGRLQILEKAFGRAVTNPSFVEWIQKGTLEYINLNARAFKAEVEKLMSATDHYREFIK